MSTKEDLIAEFVALVEEILPGFKQDDLEIKEISTISKRFRSIGEQLNAIGGVNLMQEVGAKADITPGLARFVEIVWDGIGDWRC